MPLHVNLGMKNASKGLPERKTFESKESREKNDNVAQFPPCRLDDEEGFHTNRFHTKEFLTMGLIHSTTLLLNLCDIILQNNDWTD